MLKINLSDGETRHQQRTGKTRAKAHTQKSQRQQSPVSIGQRIATFFKRGAAQQQCDSAASDMLIL